MKDIFLRANWENLVMANYEIDPSVLKAYLPEGVELDFFDNKTYVSLVGFMFKDTSIIGVPIPFFGSFEEINLRFYVKKVESGYTKRGVVFINETVPYKVVAYLANKLFNEHYISIPTMNSYFKDTCLKIVYGWKMNNNWNKISFAAELVKQNIEPHSVEQFIFERYYGYTKVGHTSTQEYKIHHSKWTTSKVQKCEIHCDFGSMYGNAFDYLSKMQPNSVFFSEGSKVAINWKKELF